MHARRKQICVLISCLLFCFAHLQVRAQSKFSIGSGECDEVAAAHPVILQTAIRTTQSGSLKAYGKLTVTRLPKKKESCQALYSLYVSTPGQPFSEVKHVEQEIEGAALAGIDVIGFSLDRTKVAADFWQSEGDWTGHAPAVFDTKLSTAAYRDLGQTIQDKIKGCDQLEDFMGVTNDGEAVFAVPPSIYDDSPGCGDKGLWHFNLQTGVASRVAKNSGIKWSK
jgi:hypothetical protein